MDTMPVAVAAMPQARFLKRFRENLPGGVLPLTQSSVNHRRCVIAKHGNVRRLEDALRGGALCVLQKKTVGVEAVNTLRWDCWLDAGHGWIARCGKSIPVAFLHRREEVLRCQDDLGCWLREGAGSSGLWLLLIVIAVSRVGADKRLHSWWDDGGEDSTLQLLACVEAFQAHKRLLAVDTRRHLVSLRNPRMRQRLGGGYPALRVGTQHHVDEALCVISHGVPLRRRIVEHGALDLRVETLLVLIPEWRVANKQDVEDHTASPNVYRPTVGFFLQHLRREVAGSTGESEPGEFVFLHLDRQAEVSQLHGSTFDLARQQQVLGLQVAMHNPFLVAVMNTVQYLLNAVACVRLAVVLASDNILEQLSTGDQVEDHVVRPILHKSIMQTNDVRMVQPSANPDFSL